MLYFKNNAPLNIIDSHFSAEWHSSAGSFSAYGGWWLYLLCYRWFMNVLFNMPPDMWAKSYIIVFSHLWISLGMDSEVIVIVWVSAR